MFKKFGFIAIALLVILSVSIFSQDTLTITGHPEYPPVSWLENGKLVGVASEIAKTVFTELGIPHKTVALESWEKVQNAAKNGEVDVVNAIYSNPERQDYMDYTLSFMKDPVAIFVWKGRDFEYNEWQDLKGKVGNTMIGESYGPEFDQFIVDNLECNITLEMIQNFHELKDRIADYSIIGLYPGLAYLHSTAFKDSVEVLSNSVVEEDFYLTFSKKSQYTHLIPQVNEIIQRLIDDGSIEKWITEFTEYYNTSKAAE